MIGVQEIREIDLILLAVPTYSTKNDEKCTRAEIVVVWGEGVSESLWKHHKSKEHEVLHRYMYPKKYQFVFYHGENQNWKIFFKQKSIFSIEMSFKIDFWKINFKWHFNWKKSKNMFFGNSDLFLKNIFQIWFSPW